MNQYPNNNFQYYYPPQEPQQYNEYWINQHIHENMLKRKERNSLILDGIVIGGTIIAYLLVQVIIVSLLDKYNLKSLYFSSSMFQEFFNVIAVHFGAIFIPFSIMAFILRKRFTGPLIPTKKLGAPTLWSWVFVGMGVCLLANVVTNLIISLFDKVGYKLSQPELAKPNDIVALIAAFIATAVVPAIFEEYGLRCCTLGALKGYGKSFAVFAVSIVFGLIHGNLIQFFFAFAVGLILGYITVVTDSVIPAMLIHGFNNGISVFHDAMTYFAGKSVANKAEVYLIVIWSCLAVGGLIYLIVERKLLPPIKSTLEIQENGEPVSRLSFGAKLACLLPGFAVPFLILFAMTAQYIQKK